MQHKLRIIRVLYKCKQRMNISLLYLKISLDILFNHVPTRLIKIVDVV